MCNKAFAKKLAICKKQYAAVSWRLQVLEVMECYWIKRPQLARLVTMMAFSALAFSLASVGALRSEPQRGRLYLISYAILIGDLIICEAVVSYWRYDRNKGINGILKSSGQLKD